MYTRPKDGLPYASQMLQRALTEGKTETVMGSVQDAKRLASRLCVSRARWRRAAILAGLDKGAYDHLIIERDGATVTIKIPGHAS